MSGSTVQVGESRNQEMPCLTVTLGNHWLMLATPKQVLVIAIKHKCQYVRFHLGRRGETFYLMNFIFPLRNILLFNYTVYTD